MKDTPAIGFHVLKNVVLSPENVLSIIASSLQWQQDMGPMVCVCDEEFYTFLYNNDLEDLYQDISPDLPPFPATEVNPFLVKADKCPDEFTDRWAKVEKVLEGLDAMKG